jgi:RNA polymerase sigma-70 factor (ECF subfamily)
MHNDFFNGIVHEWYDPLYRFALSLARNKDDALDLTQSAFYKFSSKGDGIRDRSKAKSWLFSVLHREFIDQYRRRRRYPTTTLEVVPEPVSEPFKQPASSIDAADVVSILHQMEETFRAPLTS